MLDNSEPEFLNMEAVLQEQKKFSLVDNIMMRRVEDEAILLHVATGRYFNLSESSIPFWEALENNEPFAPVIEKILEEYEVDRERVVEDLRVFLQNLLAFGVIADSH